MPYTATYKGFKLNQKNAWFTIRGRHNPRNREANFADADDRFVAQHATVAYTSTKNRHHPQILLIHIESNQSTSRTTHRKPRRQDWSTPVPDTEQQCL
jgi:hypothetical protein